MKTETAEAKLRANSISYRLFSIFITTHLLLIPYISRANSDQTEDGTGATVMLSETPQNPFTDKKIILIGNSIHVHISLGRYTTELNGLEKEVYALVEYYGKNTGRLVQYTVARQDILISTSYDPHSAQRLEYFLHYKNGGLIKLNMTIHKTKHNLFAPSITSVYLKDSEHRIVFTPDEIRFAADPPADMILETMVDKTDDEKKDLELTRKSRRIYSREIRVSFSRFINPPFLNISSNENERLAHIEVFDSSGYIESHPSVYHVIHKRESAVYEIRNEHYVYRIKKSKSGKATASRSSHDGKNIQNLKARNICNHHLKTKT